MSWREDVYQPMLQRTVENAQLRLLYQQYDLLHGSRLAAAIVREVNQAAGADEQRRGVQRVRPGEILLRTGRGPVLFALRTEENIRRALAGEPLRQIRADVIAECLLRYRKLFPHASQTQIERLLRALHIGHGCLRKRGPPHAINLPRTERPYGPVDDDTIGQLVGGVERAGVGTGQAAPRLGHDREMMQRLMYFLTEQAGVAAAVREPMILDLLRLRARFCPRINMLAAGQMPLVAMHVETGRSLHQPTRTQPLAPVLVSPLVPGELKQLTAKRYWDYNELMTLHSRRFARVMVEAYRQDGLLSYAELQWCFLTSVTMVARLVDWYQRSHHVVLPCPGSVLDMGRMMTHNYSHFKRFFPQIGLPK